MFPLYVVVAGPTFEVPLVVLLTQQMEVMSGWPFPQYANYTLTWMMKPYQQ